MKENLLKLVNSDSNSRGYGYFIIKATEQEVKNDLADIEEKYNSIIANKFFKSGMSEKQLFITKVRKTFDIFFYKYIQEYPENQFIRDGISIAFGDINSSIRKQYHYNIDYYIRKIDKHFNNKYRKGY